MDITITKETPSWTSKNHLNKVVVAVRFPNCKFVWLPSYQQMSDISQALAENELKCRQTDLSQYIVPLKMGDASI